MLFDDALLYLFINHIFSRGTTAHVGRFSSSFF
jgi:hypothetical protein